MDTAFVVMGTSRNGSCWYVRSIEPLVWTGLKQDALTLKTHSEARAVADTVAGNVGTKS